MVRIGPAGTRVRAAGWLVPLDPYVENANLTPTDWDPNDFFPELIACSRWNLGQVAGKTTTLKMIAGVEPVSSGTILLNGRPIQNLTPEERDCAMAFENYALYPLFP